MARPLVLTPTWTTGITTVPIVAEHTWNPAPILLEYRTSGLDLLNPPSLILFGDGLLVKGQRSAATGWVPLGRVLSRQEVCSLLNTLDALGFFETGPDSYSNPWPEGVETTIHVDAWQENYASGIGLACFVLAEDPSTCCLPDVECQIPEIAEVLSQVIHLLEAYDPGGLQLQASDGVVVVFREPAQPESATRDWPLVDLPLAEVYRRFVDQNEARNPLVLTGDEARQWQGNILPGQYAEGSLMVYVSSRPLWPRETPGQYLGFFDFIARTAPGEPLTCSTQDGFVPGYGP
jgi:hypothetical protein